MATISRDTVAMFDGSKTKERRIVAFTGGVYATGGDSLTPESISLKVIEAIIGLVVSNGSAIFWGFYNQTTKKILWYSATGTEVTNATDMSAYTGRFEAIGR